MAGERLSLKVELGAGDEAGADEQDELTRALREELLQLDVDTVERPAGAAPEGRGGSTPSRWARCWSRSARARWASSRA